MDFFWAFMGFQVIFWTPWLIVWHCSVKEEEQKDREYKEKYGRERRPKRENHRF